MKRGIKYVMVSGLACFLLLGTGGCGKQYQLEQVAKDWCMTIRASQVIPVYPLTEDLEPGDIFLETRPIATQHEEYRQRGFLPLEMHLARLQGMDFQKPYQHSYGIGNNTDTPHHWQFPQDHGATGLPSAPMRPAGSGEQGPPVRHWETTNWWRAPRAVFPSYSFEVDTGVAAAGTFPVQGIPVGLSLLQASRAVGTVSIGDSYVYGLPLEELDESVLGWADENKHLLSLLAKSSVEKGWFSSRPQELYLRVISRVYLTGNVAISLTDAQALAAGVVAGAAQNAVVPSLADGKLQDGYQAVLKQINEGLKAAGSPGAELKVAYAAGRSVGISQTFDRPVVIGYLGFDFPILPDGSLGPPVATLNHVSGIRVQKETPGQFTLTQKKYYQITKQIKSLPEDKQSRIYDEAAEHLGKAFKDAYTESKEKFRSPAIAFASAQEKHDGEIPMSKVHGALKAAYEENK